MNFTWFASAYNTDDVPYRLSVLVQMAGALILAAGVPRAFEHQDYVVITIGFTIIRVGLVPQWFRAAAGDPARRATARFYAAGLIACQIGWVSVLALPDGWWIAGWAILVPAELLVPVLAERKAPTPWHAEHIAERYGLLRGCSHGRTEPGASDVFSGAYGRRAHGWPCNRRAEVPGNT